MKQGFPKFEHSAKQADLGVSIVSRIVGEEFGWLFRRNHQEHDFGADGQIELVTDERSVTARCSPARSNVEIRSFGNRIAGGTSIAVRRSTSIAFANYPMPVIIFIHIHL